MARLGEARTPPGLRLYVLGDVHGRLDLLRMARRRIARDIAHRRPHDWRVIHLGDYVDRGPDSRGVLELLSGLGPAARAYCLRGNHDHCLAEFLADGETPLLYPWLDDGGIATLGSYGIDIVSPMDVPDAEARRDLRLRLIDAMPPRHAAFLAGLPHLLRLGDYAFAHAGVRPGVPLRAQTARDLMWIREPFLTSRADHGAVVVHGHTPVPEIALRPNRIGIDTGAATGGPLSCLVLEDRTVAVLGVSGPRFLDLSETAADAAA